LTPFFTSLEHDLKSVIQYNKIKVGTTNRFMALNELEIIWNRDLGKVFETWKESASKVNPFGWDEDG